jgi:hypothetical protein
VSNIEKPPAQVRVGAEFDEDIDIGVRAGVTAGGGPKDRQLANAIPPADVGDLLFWQVDSGWQGHGAPRRF